jgi:rRNA-processing protein FCF1
MILIDTNIALEYKKIPIFFYKSELVFTEPVLKEIKEKAKEKKEGALLQLIEGIKSIKTKEKIADNSILEAAVSNNYKVATFDKLLMVRLKKAGVCVIASRGELIRALDHSE